MQREPVARQRLRERSKAVFGNRDRLEVAAVIAESEDGLVNATDIAASLGLANPRVRAQLLAFTEAELLSPDSGADVKRWYVRKDSPLWQACLDLVEEWS